jgi:hypothetical protein
MRSGVHVEESAARRIPGGSTVTVPELGIDQLKIQSDRKAHALVIFLVTAMILFFSASFCMAQSDLVRLIPPDAPVIAGLHRMPEDQNKDALWLATRNNTDDLSRLVALTDNDPERRIEQVMVADWASTSDSLGSHLVIAQGRFSLTSISATMAHITKLSYDGVPVLAIKAQGGSMPIARWVAVPRSEIALFGTPSAVQVALDRFRSGAQADPQVLERLSKAHDGDAAWSSVVLAPHALRASVKLRGGVLSSCLDSLREVDLGIRIGKTVTIDLLTGSRDGSGGLSAECMSAALFGNGTQQIRIAFGGHQPDVRVTLARIDYDRWLDSFRKSQLNQTLQALFSRPDENSAPSGDNMESVR